MVSAINFFDKKRKWSIYKDQILDYYLTPYIDKILHTMKPLVIIDCFAGKGFFSDGSEGSPIIVAKQISRHLDKNVKGYFIEKKYYNDLKNNMQNFKNCNPLQGTFEDNLKSIISLSSLQNLFLYIDPYGVKSLNMSQFKRLKERNFNSLEMLMNFNSFGFLREGCRLLKYEGLFDDPDIDTGYETEENDNISVWNSIADGNYWKDLITEYKNKKIDMCQCEELFVSSYVAQLKGIFKYVVNIPIKTSEKNIPKYRLIFGTNHKDGLLLMTDNMHRAWNQIKEQLFQKGQLLLFDVGKVNEIEVMQNVMAIIPDDKNPLLKDVLVTLIQKYGIQLSLSEYKKIIKSLIGKELDVIYIPPKTATGKPVKSMDFDKYDIYLQRNKI